MRSYLYTLRALGESSRRQERVQDALACEVQAFLIEPETESYVVRYEDGGETRYEFDDAKAPLTSLPLPVLELACQEGAVTREALEQARREQGASWDLHVDRGPRLRLGLLAG